MARAKRKAKKEARGGGMRQRVASRRTAKVQKRSARKMKKVERRDATKTRRQEGRQRVKEARIDRRTHKRMAKQSVKGAKQLQKIYGELDPEEVNEINKVQPYVPAMAEELEREGVEVNDPSDPIEVSTKFAMVEDDIENPVDEELLADAYSDEENDEDETGMSDFEHAEKKFNSKRAMAVGMSAVTAGLGAYLKDVEGKKSQGISLTEREQQMLDAKKEVKKGVREKVGSDIGNTLLDLAPLLALVVIVVIVMKKN